MLDQGRLTFNGRDHGLLALGTKIIVSPAREVTVIRPADSAPVAGRLEPEEPQR